ncbi:hypothetical protein [Paenibacillus sp. JGP012]|uniref:hypothetical protein n=1 Tax=Paenibacillus sp. JGP012 TaxID=2735914 RepID=UPI00160AEAA6|nr:hypothetical protein [Paenibacillus sp. JGP012]
MSLFLIVGASYKADASEISGASILNDLQKGGYILYVRHGDATVGEDQQNFSLADCSTQRNLSALGREQAEKYGNAILGDHKGYQVVGTLKLEDVLQLAGMQ